MVSGAEKFLVKCISSKSELDNFDDIRYETYHDKKFRFDLERFPPTSETIKEHIKHAYFQCHLWQHASFVPYSESPGIWLRGRRRREIDASAMNHPADFPVPCNCIKCAKGNVCPCRVKGVACCKFCKCKAGEFCKNPGNCS